MICHVGLRPAGMAAGRLGLFEKPPEWVVFVSG